MKYEIERRLSRSLDKFQVSENKSIEYIEDELGVRFEQAPKKIELNFRNRVQLARKSGIGKFIKSSVRGQSAAFYDRRYGAIFVKGSDLFAELHENTHAFLDSVNPRIGDTINMLPIMVSKRIVGEQIDFDEVEAILVYRCFDEGVAHYGALRTAANLTQLLNQEDVFSVRNLLLCGADNIQSDQYVRSQISVVRQAIHSYESALSQNGFKVIAENMRAESHFSEAQDTVGFHFVDTFMQIFDSNRQSGEVLVELIENPPERITDLEAPQKYATYFN